MVVPQEATHEGRDGKQTVTIPANENVLEVVTLRTLEEGFTRIKSAFANLQNARLAEATSAMAAFGSAMNGYEQQMAGAAIKAVERKPDGGMEITADPTAIRGKSRGLEPGEMLPGKGILIGEFDLTDVHGKRLGIRTRWYDAAIDLGKPMTFYKTACAVEMSNQNGRGGLWLDPMCYEADLFEKLETGEAMGKNVIAPLKVVRAIYELRNRGEYKRLNDVDLPGRLMKIARDNALALCQWSCTPDLHYTDNMQAVDFTNGTTDWHNRNYPLLSGRVCFAELAL